MSYARKAVLAFVFTLAGALGTAMLDGEITFKEGTAAVGAALVCSGGVYIVRNDPA